MSGTGGIDVGTITGLLDAISTTTNTLPAQGAPTVTPTFAQAMLYLYKFAIAQMKVDSADGSIKVINPADNTTVDQKTTATLSGTVTTRAKLGTGP